MTLEGTIGGIQEENLIVRLIQNKASKEEIREMLKTLDTYIKVAVDIEKGILAGGGVMQADCESVLMENGSQQINVWGADYDPANKAVTFEALINIRPRHRNSKMEIEDPKIRAKVEKIIRGLLES